MSAKIYRLAKADKATAWERVSPNLVRHKASGVYYVRKFKAGKGELFKTTGVRKKGEAQTIADEMVAEWIGGRLRREKQLRLEQWVPEVEKQLDAEYAQGERAASTHEKDGDFLKVVSKYFGHLALDAIDEKLWAAWVRSNAWRADRATLFDVAKYLGLVLTRAHREGLINRKPKIHNPDRPKAVGTEKLVSPAELQAIARTLAAEDNEWLLLQLYLGAECGNRTGEIRTLRWDMITFDTLRGGEKAATIRFKLDKASRARGKGREFLASPRASKLLHQRYQIQFRDGSAYVFPAPTNAARPQTKVYQNRAWRQALRAAGITRPIWFYWLRHTFYTRALLDARMPIQHVSEFGGTSIRTLQKVYLHSDAVRTRDVSTAVSIGPIRGKLVKGDGEEE